MTEAKWQFAARINDAQCRRQASNKKLKKEQERNEKKQTHNNFIIDWELTHKHCLVLCCVFVVRFSYGLSTFMLEITFFYNSLPAFSLFFANYEMNEFLQRTKWNKLQLRLSRQIETSVIHYIIEFFLHLFVHLSSFSNTLLYHIEYFIFQFVSNVIRIQKYSEGKNSLNYL